MGTAVARINRHALAELMGISQVAEIVNVFPPSFTDVRKQEFVMILESPEFPQAHHMMPLMEVHICYTSKADKAEFSGFEVIGEIQEPGMDDGMEDEIGEGGGGGDVPPGFETPPIFPINPTYPYGAPPPIHGGN